MSERKKSRKALRKESYSVAQTSTEEMTALEGASSETLTQKPKDKLEDIIRDVLSRPRKPRRMTFGTGREGMIQLQLALDNEARHQLGKPPLTEQETADLIEKYRKELPDVFYQVKV